MRWYLGKIFQPCAHFSTVSPAIWWNTSRITPSPPTAPHLIRNNLRLPDTLCSSHLYDPYGRTPYPIGVLKGNTPKGTVHAFTVQGKPVLSGTGCTILGASHHGPDLALPASQLYVRESWGFQGITCCWSALFGCVGLWEWTAVRPCVPLPDMIRLRKGKPETHGLPENVLTNYQRQPSLFAVMAAIFVFPWISDNTDLSGIQWKFQSEQDQNM